MLNVEHSRDEFRQRRDIEYREGLAFVEISSRTGRPPVGDTVLDKLTVTSELRDALKVKSEELGLSMPETRREAYRRFTE